MDTIIEMETYQLIIFILLGLTVLLFGYRIKRIAFFIIWFILGFNLVTILLPTIGKIAPDVINNALWQNLLPIAGGLLLAMLGFTIEKLCVGGICFALTMIVTVRYFGTEIQILAIGAIVAIILAGLAVTMMRPAIIVATSIAGAYALTLVIFAFFPQFSMQVFYWPVLIGLTAIGSLFQFSTSKHLL
ncbi:DUF4203 domain-containing protein [Candidatus Saccharibacteria bacterium]|nr:DUF4203 domain-containing protein [Candidatus Saccharibacteria bacterium]